MPMLQLTGKDNLGNTCPLLINSDHIVSMRPRIGSRPTGLSQNPEVAPISMGTEVSLVNGDSHIVTDSYDKIVRALTAAPHQAPQTKSVSTEGEKSSQENLKPAPQKAAESRAEKPREAAASSTAS